MLPQVDREILQTRNLDHTVSVDGGMTCVVITNYRLPDGLNQRTSNLLLRLSPGYPDVPPDMWWFSPSVARADGQAIAATQVIESYFGRQWQRWSRHLSAGVWKSGIDSLESYLALVNHELSVAANTRSA